MLGTLFGIIAGLLLYFRDETATILQHFPLLPLIVGSTLIIILLLIQSYMANPLQRSEHGLTPRVNALMKRNWLFIGTHALILFFFFFSFFPFFKPADSRFFLLAWTILLGLSLDALIFMVNKYLRFLDPMTYVDEVVYHSRHEVLESKQKDFCAWIDALTELGVKSINTSSLSVAMKSVDGLLSMIESYLESGRRQLTNSTHIEDVIERLNFIIVYFFQRLELIYIKSLESNLEPLSSHIILQTGKVIIYAAKCDSALALSVIHYLGKFNKEASQRGLEELSVKGALTFQQVGIAIIQDRELFSTPIEEIFLSIINHLEAMAKTAFKKNKTINLELLTQPFRKLLAEFQKPDKASHPDAPVIIGELERVIGEFDALGMVLANMPNIPGYHPPESASASPSQENPPIPEEEPEGSL